MKLKSKEALKILEESRVINDKSRWVDHSICVGNTAGILAKALELDEDYAKTLGYIHDIGKKFDYENDGVFSHLIKGYKYLKTLGYGEEYAGICIKHSFLNNDINCLANDRNITDQTNVNYEFVKKYIKNKYTIYDKIINLCDLMCTEKVQTVDKRLIDLLRRHGLYKNTLYHIEETYKLKQYFDNKVGRNIYSLCPEISDNL